MSADDIKLRQEQTKHAAAVMSEACYFADPYAAIQRSKAGAALIDRVVAFRPISEAGQAGIARPAVVLGFSTCLNTIFVAFKTHWGLPNATQEDQRRLPEWAKGVLMPNMTVPLMGSPRVLLKQLAQKGRLVLCGHSLGGTLAVVNGIDLLQSLQDLKQPLTNICNAWEGSVHDAGIGSISIVTFGAPTALADSRGQVPKPVKAGDKAEAPPQWTFKRSLFHRCYLDKDFKEGGFIYRCCSPPSVASLHAAELRFKDLHLDSSEALQETFVFIEGHGKPSERGAAMWQSYMHNVVQMYAAVPCAGTQWQELGSVSIESSAFDGSATVDNDDINQSFLSHSVVRYLHAFGPHADEQPRSCFTGAPYFSDPQRLLPLSDPAVTSVYCLYRATFRQISVHIESEDEHLAELIAPVAYQNDGRTVSCKTEWQAVPGKTVLNVVVEVPLDHAPHGQATGEKTVEFMEQVAQTLQLKTVLGTDVALGSLQIDVPSLGTEQDIASLDVAKHAMLSALVQQMERGVGGRLAPEAEKLAQQMDQLLLDAAPHLVVSRVPAAFAFVASSWSLELRAQSSSGPPLSALDRALPLLRDEVNYFVTRIKGSRKWIESSKANVLQLGTAAVFTGSVDDRSYREWKWANKPTLGSVFGDTLPSFTAALREYARVSVHAPSTESEMERGKRLAVVDQALCLLLTRMIVVHTIILTQLLPPVEWIDKHRRKLSLVKAAAWAAGFVAATVAASFVGSLSVLLLISERLADVWLHSAVCGALGLSGFLAGAQAVAYAANAAQEQLTYVYEETFEQLYRATTKESSTLVGGVASAEMELCRRMAAGAETPLSTAWRGYAVKLRRNMAAIGGLRLVLRDVKLGLRVGPLGPSGAGKTKLLSCLVNHADLFTEPGQQSRTRSYASFPIGQHAVLLDIPGIDDAEAAQPHAATLHPAKLATHIVDVLLVVIEASNAHTESAKLTLRMLLEGASEGLVKKPFVVLLSKTDELLNTRDDDRTMLALIDAKKVVLDYMKQLLRPKQEGPNRGDDEPGRINMLWPKSSTGAGHIAQGNFWVNTVHHVDSLVHLACFENDTEEFNVRVQRRMKTLVPGLDELSQADVRKYGVRAADSLRVWRGNDVQAWLSQFPTVQLEAGHNIHLPPAVSEALRSKGLSGSAPLSQTMQAKLPTSLTEAMQAASLQGASSTFAQESSTLTSTSSTYASTDLDDDVFSGFPSNDASVFIDEADWNKEA